MISKNIFLFFLIQPILFCSAKLYAQTLTLKKVLQGRVEINLPSDFERMDTVMLSLKYPLSAGRPDEAYTNNNASVSIAFNHTLQKASDEEIKSNKDRLVELLKKRPGVRIISQSTRIVNGKSVIVISFYSTSANETIYNSMFITSLNNRILMGSFNCVSYLEDIWKSKSEEIIRSLKIKQ